MGMNGGPVYARACAESLPRLFALIGAPDSRSAENNTATENAISAVTKIFKHNNSCIDNLDKVRSHYPSSFDEIPLVSSFQLHQVWLTWFPVYEDTEESPFVYGYLCDLIES